MCNFSCGYVFSTQFERYRVAQCTAMVMLGRTFARKEVCGYNKSRYNLKWIATVKSFGLNLTSGSSVFSSCKRCR